MARKRRHSSSDEENDDFKRKKHYPYYSLFSRKKSLSDDDKTFILLLHCGMPSTKAYRIAYRSQASNSSIAAMASRLKGEPWVEETFDNLRRWKPWWKSGYDYKEYVYE